MCDEEKKMCHLKLCSEMIKTQPLDVFCDFDICTAIQTQQIFTSSSIWRQSLCIQSEFASEKWKLCRRWNLTLLVGKNICLVF